MNNLDKTTIAFSNLDLKDQETMTSELDFIDPTFDPKAKALLLEKVLKGFEDNGYLFTVSAPVLKYDINSKVVVSISLQRQNSAQTPLSPDKISVFKAKLQKFISQFSDQDFSVKSVEVVDILLPDNEIRKWQPTFGFINKTSASPKV